MAPKRVVLLIIDGLAPRVIQRALDSGELPLLAQWAQRGAVQQCVSIFPSITPAATASLVTGQSPVQHGIQGAYWRDRADGETAYFGAAPQVIFREGFGDFVDDFLITLNDQLLQTPTLFELVEDAGKRAACLNFMWRRGRTPHAVNTPLLMQLLAGNSFSDEVRGPHWLFLGDFVASRLAGDAGGTPPGGPLRRYGFCDDATCAQLEALAASDDKPDLTVAYFPDNDFKSHDVGGEDALPVVQSIDKHLGEMVERLGGVDRWLEETAVIVVGDHGHNDLVDDKQQRWIDLEELLDRWRLVPAGEEWGDEDDLFVCPNMRAAQVTTRRGEEHLIEPIAQRLLNDERIDQAIWRPPGDVWFRVLTSDRGSLEFCEEEDEGAESGETAVDSRNRRWRFRGSLDAVDASVDEQGRLTYGDYLDALGRIAAGSPACQASLWVAARPGHEFSLPATETHPAGSHGSLHASDSNTTLITAGLPEGVSPPRDASITDVAGLCCASLGVEPPARGDDQRRTAAPAGEKA